MAVRILSITASTCWKRIIGSSHTFQRANASSHQDSQRSHDQSFWEIEGSVAVNPNQIGDLSYLEKKEEKTKLSVEESDVVRITKFGHVRLDHENCAMEIKDSEDIEHSDSNNYIDNQFFSTSSSQSKSLSSQDDYAVKASDVPVDTNSVDQQYFYPNSSPQTKEPSQLAPPYSASELEFKENEIDDQYFGGKSVSSEKAKQKVVPSKVSAYTYLRSLQSKSAEITKNTIGIDLPVKNNVEVPQFTYADIVPDLFKMPNELIVNLLKRSILYNKDGLVVLNKPYGLVTTDSDGKAQIVLTDFLVALSKALRFEKLYTVHRLDRDTTGILLLASNQEVANQLNTLFLEHQIEKKYLAITKGIPNPREGTIDIPLCEKSLGNRQRMALRPILKHSDAPIKSAKYNAKGKSFKAITHFQVKRSSGSAAFIELEPETGVRHQLRVHLSEALGCPVLGDHKYSHDDKYAPQKLPKDMLERLNIKQSKVRNIPMHLHAASISIPGFGEQGKELRLFSPLPNFFRYTMKKLLLYSSKAK